MRLPGLEDDLDEPAEFVGLMDIRSRPCSLGNVGDEDGPVHESEMSCGGGVFGVLFGQTATAIRDLFGDRNGDES